jgi:hypothetical protein
MLAFGMALPPPKLADWASGCARAAHPVRMRHDKAERAALWQAAQHGVIAARTLVSLGVPESTVYRRCRDGGPWQRLAPGIVLMATGTPTVDQRVVAALLHGGDGAILTGVEACRRLGIRRGPPDGGPLHVLVPHTRQVRNTELTRIERTTRLPRPMVRDGVPLAPAGRAVVDTAKKVRSGAAIAELAADAVQHNLCTVEQLAEELATCGRRGSATPRDVIRDVAAGVRSAAERDAKKLSRRSGLPEPMWNAAVYGSDGALLGIADAWWDDVGLAWEINSFAWHLLPADYAKEQAKRARFAAAGVPVLPTLPRRLHAEGHEVIKEMQKAYAAAGGAPRPPVRAVPSQHGGFTPTTLE